MGEGERERDRQTDRQTDRQRQRHTERETETETDRDRQRQRQRQRQGRRDRDRETETKRQTETQTDRQSSFDLIPLYFECKRFALIEEICRKTFIIIIFPCEYSIRAVIRAESLKPYIHVEIVLQPAPVVKALHTSVVMAR